MDLMQPRRPLSSQSSSAGCASVTPDAVAWSWENNSALFFFSFFFSYIFSINTALNSLAAYHFAVTIVPQRPEDILQYLAWCSIFSPTPPEVSEVPESLLAQCDNSDGCFGVCLASGRQTRQLCTCRLMIHLKDHHHLNTGTWCNTKV